MKIAINIPIKGRSATRVPNKNLRDLAGKPLCCWLLDQLATNLPEEWDIYIDSEKDETFEFIKNIYGDRFKFHKREEWLAGDTANGNHLLSNFATHNPDYDVYAQTFITAVTLPGSLIKETIEDFFTYNHTYDSAFLCTEETGFFWNKGEPVNYDAFKPNGMKRSQDIKILKETVGLYVINKPALVHTGCRIGENPKVITIDEEYAVDIDTMTDFEYAQRILSEKK